MDKNFDYGILDRKTNKVYKNNDALAPECQKMWILSTPQEIIKSMVGTCWDMVEFERHFFSKNNYSFHTFFIWFKCKRINNYPTHTYLVYQDKVSKKWCWFEYSDFANRGIQEFNSILDAVQTQKQKMIAFAKSIRKSKTDASKIEIMEYNTPPSHCDFDGFIEYVTTNGKRL